MSAATAVMMVMTGLIPAKAQVPSGFEDVQVISAVPPVYPVLAANAGVSGDTVVEVSIRKDGGVSSTRAVSGHKLLCPMAERFAKRWRFSSSDRAAVRVVRLQFSFVLLSNDASVEDEGTTYFPPCRIELRAKPAEYVHN
jgi:hypothetical protein